MKEITEEEIKKAERLLLPEGKTFNDPKSERLAVIKEITNNLDVVACPGSGKTTVLLAKLIILADRMPFDDGGGICVLTHTNVAIDEIKERLGSASSKLFAYPNFFGTIQSFVDRFLAIPQYINWVGEKPIIDNDIFNTKIDFQFKNYNQYRLLNKSKYTKGDQVRAKHYLNNHQVSSLRFIIDAKGEVEVSQENLGTKLIVKPPKNAKGWNSQTPDIVYNWIKDFKRIILWKEKSLCFDDAYFVGQLYLNKYNTKLRDAFSKRFKYVFVDEMQDTYKHQLDIIEGLFEGTNTITQYFGDPNQAIFNKVEKDMVWQIGRNNRKELKISDSKRFGDEIANLVDQIKVNQNITITGNPEVTSLKPKLIIFKKGEEEKVIEKFADLIFTHEGSWLDNYTKRKKKPTHKAVGWVGKDKTEEDIDAGKLNIKAYFKNFENKKEKQKKTFTHLKHYLRKNDNADKQGIKWYSDMIIAALLETLDKSGVKREVTILKKGKSEVQQRHYTKTSFLNNLKEEHPQQHRELLTRIAKWSYDIHTATEEYNDKVFLELVQYIRNDLSCLFNNFTINSELDEFLNEPTSAPLPSEATKKTEFLNFKNEEGKEVTIEVGTVHSVKGETHAATLYLENYYYRIYESQRVCDFTSATTESKKQACINKQYHNETLKMLHVGFSRPTHLLCFAVCEDRVTDDLKELFKHEMVCVYVCK